MTPTPERISEVDGLTTSHTRERIPDVIRIPVDWKRDVTRYLTGRRLRRHCPHSRLQPLYGDRVNDIGGWRLICLDCDSYIDGPVTLAKVREAELDLW